MFVVENLQITGEGLAPVGGPTEIGILIVNGRAVAVNKNVISSVNLGIFVRGAASTGNRIFENVIVGGSTPGNNLLGICYNPASGAATAILTTTLRIVPVAARNSIRSLRYADAAA